MNENLIEVREYNGNGYKPLVPFEAWLIAMLRYVQGLEPQNINSLQRHDITDEAFILLAGNCTLILGDGAEDAGNLHFVPMEPLKIYNIKKGVFHSHSLSKDATVLIVENSNTANENSLTVELLQAQREQITQAIHF